jgi:hypothetical protein
MNAAKDSSGKCYSIKDRTQPDRIGLYEFKPVP